jgi:hypothetical protein
MHEEQTFESLVPEHLSQLSTEHFWQLDLSSSGK